MQIKELFEDDDAVSPVIGVILMVAITVILAAVIGTFVLGLGEQVGNAQPTTTFDFNFESSGSGSCNGNLHAADASGDTGSLDITHNGGNDINENRLSLKDTNDAESITDLEVCTGVGSDGVDLTTGDQISPGVGNDDVVEVVWTASGGGDSAPLGTWEGPAA